MAALRRAGVERNPNPRHCERSEAIHRAARGHMDCFVAFAPRNDDCEAVVAYSITWSALASKVGGSASPSAFAVLMLATSSNLVGCWTGNSAGLAPLRIRPI